MFVVLLFDIIKTGNIEWVGLDGHIVSKNIEENITTKGTSWCPRVKYEYQINDIKYINDKIYKNTPCELTKHSARSEIKEYKEGQAVQVFYNANDPEVSALIIGLSWFDYFKVVLTFIATVFGIFVLIIVNITKKSR